MAPESAPYLVGDDSLEGASALGPPQEADLVPGGRLDEGRDHLPQTPEDEGGIQKPQLGQPLRVVPLQHLKNGCQHLHVQVG